VRWSTLKKLSESKAFWGLNGFLLIVPAVAKYLAHIETSLPLDMFWLYIAAWILLLAGGLIIICKPSLIEYTTFSSFKERGCEPAYLREIFLGANGNLGSADLTQDIKTRLENSDNATDPHPAAFWFVYNFLDKTRPLFRGFITALVVCAGLILLGTNVNRFGLVYKQAFGNSSEETAMNKGYGQSTGLQQSITSANMTVGGPIDVTHENGIGGTSTTSGVLVNDDDNGYVVVKRSDEKLVRIPKGRVITIIDS
jgi:hypothetical protein